MKLNTKQYTPVVFSYSRPSPTKLPFHIIIYKYCIKENNSRKKYKKKSNEKQKWDIFNKQKKMNEKLTIIIFMKEGDENKMQYMKMNYIS